MFSLNFRQPTVTPSGRFEWHRHPLSAMCCAQACAFAVSTEWVPSAAIPREVRTALIRLVKLASALASAACAAVPTPMPTVDVMTMRIAATIRRMCDIPPLPCRAR